MDLMATPASAQWTPASGSQAARRLLFYSKQNAEGSSGVDVLSQDVSSLPGQTGVCFGFSIPPIPMIGVISQHIAECKARAVLIIPDQKLVWLPLIDEATVRSAEVSTIGDDSAFFRVHQQRGRVPFAFIRGAMRMVEVYFN